MFKKKRTNNSSFWISYADLMAGLLFIFILLIGTIVSKSIVLRETLQVKEQALEKTTTTLKEKEQGLLKLTLKIQQQKKELQLKDEKINSLQEKIKELEYKLNSIELALLSQNKALSFEKNRSRELTKRLSNLETLLEESNKTLADKEVAVKECKDEITALTKALESRDENLKDSDDRVQKLLDDLDEKRNRYEEMISKIESQRERIKHLTGLKLKVIKELKQSLGDNLDVTKDGAMKLSSKILFDKGSAKLKNRSKKQIRKLFNRYIEVLFGNKDIAPHIDKILIEGHTDSDGSFIYNLELSQARALNVMKYLLTLPIVKKYNLKDKLVATGRSYLEPVIVNGREDKDKSRRIEIKFRLKNQAALDEIERMLDENR